MIVGITGSEGLIGKALAHALRAAGHAVDRFDVRLDVRFDVRDPALVGALADRCDGIVHLAAESRVARGERNPTACLAINVGGTHNVVRAARRASKWVLVASSREVYGVTHGAVSESAPRRPINVYGWSKVAAEAIAHDYARAAVVRFSNVYGSVSDHADRVVPAFCRASAIGGAIRVDGDVALDFVHVRDAVRGVLALIDRVATTDFAPTVHLCSGRITSLAALATIANATGGHRARMIRADPRPFDVDSFVGDPRLAKNLIGWTSAVRVEEGVAELVAAFESARKESHDPG
ncbi:MAG: NAD(P)-dependent oxidoreductase [Dehalococcoidia bacterium]|nr:NAD(P)-dependent oxidoreductase [Dehalococcoidia bacterium]